MGAAGKEHLTGKLHSGVQAVSLVTKSLHTLWSMHYRTSFHQQSSGWVHKGSERLPDSLQAREPAHFAAPRRVGFFSFLLIKEKKKKGFYGSLKAANQIIKVLKSLMKKSKLLSKHSAWCLFPFLPTLSQCIQNFFLLCYNMFEQVLRYKQVLAPSHTEWIGCRCSPASYILPPTRAFISKTHHFTYFAWSQNSKVI